MSSTEIALLAVCIALYIHAGRQAFLLFLIFDRRARRWSWLVRYRDRPHDWMFQLIYWGFLLTWPVVHVTNGRTRVRTPPSSRP